MVKVARGFLALIEMGHLVSLNVASFTQMCFGPQFGGLEMMVRNDKHSLPENRHGVWFLKEVKGLRPSLVSRYQTIQQQQSWNLTSWVKMLIEYNKTDDF